MPGPILWFLKIPGHAHDTHNSTRCLLPTHCLAQVKRQLRKIGLVAPSKGKKRGGGGGGSGAKRGRG